MFLFWAVTSAADAKNYFSSCFTPGEKPSRQEYYSEGQESPGRFGGELGKQLGLYGQVVDKATFDRLCDNRHPTEKGTFTPRTNDQRRICYDLTISAPKSFSIVEAFADEAERLRLRQAFDAAIEETVAADIEPDMQTRVRSKGADFNRLTGNVLTAGFDHATARPVNDNVPPDPHKHKHLLIWNATFDPVENRIKAGQFGDIIRDKGYYYAAFSSRLAGKLEAMGYAIDWCGGNEWQIAGVPRSLIETFSKRTARIEGEAEKRGIRDKASKAKLGAKIRSLKQKEWTLAELRQAWREQCSAEELAAMERVYRREGAEGVSSKLAISPVEAVRFAIHHCSEQHSMVAERELKRVALLYGLGSVSVEQVAAELPRQGVITGLVEGRKMATTRELIAEEQFMVGFAANGRGTLPPLGIAAGLERGKLNDGQWAAVRGLLESPHRVSVLEGPAGAGKTTALQKYDQGVKLAGGRAFFFATTSAATDVLSKDGFDAHTVARLLVDEAMQKKVRGSRLVVDESSMLGHKDAVKLFRLAEELGATLILVGDDRQHGAVPRGALLPLLKQYAGLKPFRLEEIIRQEDTGYRAAAQAFSEGKTLEGFDALARKGWVKEVSDDQERYRRIAEAVAAAEREKKSLIVVSPSHAEGRRITEAIRGVLREAGRLGGEERRFTRLEAANASEAERGVLSTYRQGEVLQFTQNAPGFTKGDRLVVDDVSNVPLGLAARFQLYRPQEIGLSAGDTIRMTANVKTSDGKHKLANGSSYGVAGFTPSGDIRLGNGWVIAKDAGHFRHGYVDTSFSSQGKTTQLAIVAVAAESLAASNREMAYVASTRAREKVEIFTDDAAELRKAIQRSSRKPVALDLIGKAKGKPVEAKPQARELAAAKEQTRRQRKRRWQFLGEIREGLAAMWRPAVAAVKAEVSYGRGR